MKYYILFFFAFAVATHTWAQNQEKVWRDSLQKPTTADSNKIKAMLNLGNVLSTSDSVMAGLRYIETALKMAEQKNNPKLIAFSHLTLATTHQRLGNPAEALKNYRLASQLFEKLKIFNQHIHCLQCIGKMHEIQLNYDRALQYYQEALDKASKKNITTQISFAYNNIGNVYFYKKAYPKAIAYQLKGIDIRKKYDSTSIQYSYHDLASIYNDMGKKDSAVYYLQKAHQTAQKYNDIQFIALGAISFAAALDSAGRHKEALDIAEKGLEIAQKLGIKSSISDLTRYLAASYTLDNQPAKAIQMYEMHTTYRDSLATEERTREIAKLETNHEIERHAQEAQKVRAEQQQQRYWLIATSVGIILLLGVAVALVKLNNDRRKANLDLQEKNEEINQQKEELTIIAENLETANQEINQKNEELTIIAENLETANQEINQKNEDVTASISYASRIQQAILPTLDELKRGFTEVFVLFCPRDVVSGDFYFFSMVGKEHIFAVADCTGHGVPGALMSMVGNELLHEIVDRKHFTVPAEILTALHKGVRQALKQHETDNRDGMDIAIINHNAAQNTLQFAGAKNPIVYIQNNELKYIKGNALTIGGEQREQERVFDNHTLPTQDITWVYMFSDGFQDQFGGAQNKKYTITKLRELLGNISIQTPEYQHKALLSAFQNWRTEAREKQIDDVLVAGVRLS